MQASQIDQEYSYKDSEPGHHHAYLLSPLLNLLSKKASTINTNTEQLRILDIGCGNGSLTSIWAKQGHQVIGIEASESGVKFARQKHTNCEFVLGSVYDPVPHNFKNFFDIVISAEVIEHLYYPKQLAQYARQCLKPHGQLIVSTPYHGYWKNLILAASGKMDRHFTALWDDGHIKFFSVNTLSNLLREEGFSNLKFNFAGRFPYLWKSMLCSCSLSGNE